MAYNDSWAVGTTADRKVGTEDARRGVGALWVPGTAAYNVQSGIRVAPGDPGKVAATGTPGANVTVNALQAILDLAARPGAYIATMDAQLTVDVLGANPADPTNQRNDLIVAQQNDADYGDANRNFQVVRITGTPSGSPSDPSVPGSANYITLARIRVTAGATTITNAMIDDLRPAWIVALGGLKPVRTTTERTALTPYDGMPIYRLDRDWLEIYDGTAWRVQNTAVCSSTADRDSAITSPYNGQLAFTTDTNTLWARQSGAWVALPDAPTFHLRRNALQTITNATFTAVNFDVEDEDSHNGHSTSSNTDRYTVVKAGVYEIQGAASFVPNATGIRVARLTLNGTAINGGGGQGPNLGAGENSFVATQAPRVRLAVNDIVRLEVWQNSGGNLDTATVGYSQPALSGHWIKP